jgi:hypothetical protein
VGALVSYLILPDAKAYIGNTQPTDDDLIEKFIAAAQAFIEGPQGAQRVYEASIDSTRQFDAECDVDGRLLYLDADLCQITSITNGDGQLVSASQYVCETAGGERNKTPWRRIRLRSTATVSWLASATTGPENAISIAGRWAYSLTPPTRIVQLTREIVAYLYRRRSASGDADRPLLTGDGVMLLPSALPKGIMAQLIAERMETSL